MEYLIEIKKSLKVNVPDDWKQVNSTKAVIRYRNPFINENYAQLCLGREKLELECRKAWKDFCSDFSRSYFHQYQRAVSVLADLDCLYALSQISMQEGFTKPEISDAEEQPFDIVSGRHPIIEATLSDSQFVPNSLNLTPCKTLVLTGPNMGGKSSFLRQTALIVILAQIGCFVPALKATLPVIDGIYIRIGAKDDILAKKSTLMIELEEASFIMKHATKKSLVLMDELGRGTSTYDGMAIAGSVLKYLREHVLSFTVFVTHYKPLTCQDHDGKNFVNGHMGYTLIQDSDNDNNNDESQVVFLYEFKSGVSDKSYGLNVAKLAGLPQHVLQKASNVAQKYEKRDKLKWDFYKLLESMK